MPKPKTYTMDTETGQDAAGTKQATENAPGAGTTRRAAANSFGKAMRNIVGGAAAGFGKVAKRRNTSAEVIPTVAQARQRIRNRTSFLASLTAPQWEAIRDYDGPEVLGGPDTPRRKR